MVRENTEGLYAGRERVEDDGATAIAERVVTRRASARIMRVACDLARARRSARGGSDAPPGKVTVVHKANVLRETCGLFRSVALEAAQAYPDLQIDEMLVDTCALQLATRPERFDVIVTTNLFGDILSDLCAQLVGGMGFAYSGNIGDNYAVFEPTHGSAPKYAGLNKVNPIAAILAAAMMAGWTGEKEVEAAIHKAVEEVVRRGEPRTYDMGGSSTTMQMAEAIAAEAARIRSAGLSG